MSEFGVDRRIKMGSFGWDHKDWQGPFYPDDLPADWRLSYYANEFSVVLVPFSVWTADECATWHDDVPESFRFVLDITPFSGEKDVLRCLKVVVDGLGDRLAGIVSWAILSSEEARQIESTVGSGLLITPSPDDISPVIGMDRASNSALVCLLLPDELGRDLVALRVLMESLMIAEASWHVAMIFFSGEPPAIKVIKDAEVLQQLLG
ncbi:DUF72 domain-containing protein [Sedimenticola selenatireducens]|uniref:DUF72 domain-containing protein n=1 Tax=Sedimenticola selenatireducens TaxID=191960 RepID=A0A557SI00_9GAMM|nr:DUF72 domain-containing protein [Sedimenticola selenatireducens]TVO77056.1 DUF72 domain-containing protein [Sedimenticola selenatireducens]TVT64498.1 MAG: DUF72 domain-containing protein [Sedimenticola selenatireducens]